MYLKTNYTEKFQIRKCVCGMFQKYKRRVIHLKLIERVPAGTNFLRGSKGEKRTGENIIPYL